MQTWIKVVPADQMVEHEDYFIGRIRNKGDAFHECCDLLGRGLDGKTRWTGKPGIAIKVECDDGLRALLAKNPDWSVIAIPADADKRWRARKPSRRNK
jgi:hypothetical protein